MGRSRASSSGGTENSCARFKSYLYVTQEFRGHARSSRVSRFKQFLPNKWQRYQPPSAARCANCKMHKECTAEWHACSHTATSFQFLFGFSTFGLNSLRRHHPGPLETFYKIVAFPIPPVYLPFNVALYRCCMLMSASAGVQ